MFEAQKTMCIYIQIGSITKFSKLQCIDIQSTISFDNSFHDSVILCQKKVYVMFRQCLCLHSLSSCSLGIGSIIQQKAGSAKQ